MPPFFRKFSHFSFFWLSLALSAAIIARGVAIGLAPSEIARLWPFIVLCPALLGFFRFVVIAFLRRRARQAEPRSEDAERSARKVGTVGRRYLIGVALVVVALQAQWLGESFGLAIDRDVLARGLFVAIGGLMIYFGNVVPKIAPPHWARDPAAHRRAARLLGWVYVIEGVLVCLGALLLAMETIVAILPAVLAAMVLCVGLALVIPRLLKLAKGR